MADGIDTGALQSDRRSNGQVVVIFAGAMLVMTLMMAIVIDLSWLWSSALKIQRAADAAALAGAVTLPKDSARGYQLARKEATKNGFEDGVGGVIVNPAWDPAFNPYRLNVSITVPIGTFFMRVIGMGSVDVTRTAHAEFNLPLKMGSPQQWYGVGTFEKLDRQQGPDVPGPTTDTGFLGAGTTPNGIWSNPQGADLSNDDNFAVSPVIDGSVQQWGGFGLTAAGAIPPKAVIEGIEVRYRALITGAGGATATCRLQTHLSWDGGGTWTTAAVNQDLTTTEVEYTIGSPLNLDDWPRPPTDATWTFSSFTNSNFRLRLTWTKPSCGAGRTASVDTLAIRVTYHPMLPGPITYTPITEPVPTPPGETVAPTSQGFWGAILTAGGVRQNGDRYSPLWYADGSAQANAEHISDGYDYIVEVGGSNGRVHLFDPVFCATGQNPAGSGNYGAGDHWTSLPASGGVTNGPVTTEFTLYNTNGTVLDTTDDTLVSGLPPYTTRASDQSGEFDDPDVGGPGAGDIPTGPPITDCQAHPAHNKWVTMKSGLATGTYRLNVKSSQAGNNATGAENLWSIYVGDDGGPGSARVYGLGRMAAYSNLTGANPTDRQTFYLAQIEAVHAGKTMEVKLFDPGDVAGNATLRILSPDGDSYDYATFDYQADGECNAGTSDVCAATARTSIKTAVGGASSFDNSVITITIPLPTTYGNGGLTPGTESEPGWWKIEYEVAKANDTTTWEVSILENLVHLVVE